MDHLSAATEVSQHAVRESTNYILQYQRRTLKLSLVSFIHKRIEKSSYTCMWNCNFSGPSKAIGS